MILNCLVTIMTLISCHVGASFISVLMIIYFDDPLLRQSMNDDFDQDVCLCMCVSALLLPSTCSSARGDTMCHWNAVDSSICGHYYCHFVHNQEKKKTKEGTS